MEGQKEVKRENREGWWKGKKMRWRRHKGAREEKETLEKDRRVRKHRWKYRRKGGGKKTKKDEEVKKK